MNYGGASKVVLELGSRLNNQGLDAKIITTKINPEVIKDYTNLKFISLSNISTGNLFFWILSPFFYLKLSRLLKKQDAKIIFAHSLAIYWGAACKFVNKKLITVNYFHDLGMPYFDDKEELEGLPKFSKFILKIISPIFKILNRFAINQTDFIISNSKFTALEIEKKYDKKADLIIYPAVDYEIFKPAEEKSDYIYTLGRLEKIKKIDLIIRSFSKYIEKYGNRGLGLLIIGSGIEEASLKSLCRKLKIENRVTFEKNCSPLEVSKLAARAKIGLFFRKNEPFGIGAIESMACGTPVIGVNRGGIAETVIDKQTGLLSDLDENEIANKINGLLSDKEKLEKLSKNARTHVKENYSWDKSAEILRQFFIKL